MIKSQIVIALQFGAVWGSVGPALLRAASPNPRVTLSSRPGHIHLSVHVVHSGAVSPWSLVVPTWIGAIATFGLLVGAIVTAKYAIRAFGKQSEEVSLLKDEAERDYRQRRLAQAILIFIYIDYDREQRDPQMAAVRMDAAMRSGDENTTLLAAVLSNTSKQPVYDIAVQWSIGGNLHGGQHVKPQLKPGEEILCTQVWLSTGGISGLAVTLDFTDAARVRWRTNDRGELVELCGVRRLPPNTAYCALPPGHSGDHIWDSISQVPIR